MDEEIDFRPYIELLIERRSWILIGAIIAAVSAFIISSVLPKTYVASSGVAIVRSRTDVSFGSQIRTQSEDQLGTINQDKELRRDALVALVKTGDVASLVLEEIGASLDPEEQTVTKLLEMVEASSTGDLILISINHSNPEIAALIANAWGNKYEEYINELYRDEPGINLELLVEQAIDSKISYEEAQSELESFIESNDIQLLNQEIESRQAVLSTTLAARNNVQAGPANLQLETDKKIQNDLYSNLQKIERWHDEAIALRGQIASNSNSAATDISNVLSFIGLSTRVYGGAVSTDLQLDISSEISSNFEVRASDVDTLIEVIETRRESTLSQISALQEALLTDGIEETRLDTNHSLNTNINNLNAEIQTLRAEIEKSEAVRRELSEARDLAWDRYQSLLRKQVEEEILAQTTGTEVKFASSAVQPGGALSQRRIANTLIAAILATGAVVFGIFINNWWQQSKPIVDVAGESEK